MNAKVVYYTKSGNTQKIAEAIGSAVGCPVMDVRTKNDDAVDVLFLGASVYKFGIDKEVKAYIDGLNPAKVGEVVIFSTSAMSDSGYPKLVALLKNRGIAVFDRHFYCRGAFMMANKNRPNQEDIAKAKAFAVDFLK
ncbi:flavodoxin family protein [Bengtsoniella intestinalis]|uniref:flavodoxin family protein n=1 Tax=Bengtsoniella intestinalis TaxID=3073143 RepID=UPI00391F1B5C